jgi:lysozyme
MILGIDVSDYQGNVDWNAVAQSGRQFAFAKATEGTNFVCRTFAGNWAGMQAAGLIRGAYHFARPDSNSPEAEADFFLQQVGDLSPGDLLVLDLEAGSGDLSAWASAWLQHVYEQVGFRPLLYSGSWFLSPHRCTSNDFLGQHGLWLAAYQSEMPSPPPGWPVLAFWQHTDAASVPGVGGGCDQSYFNGDDIETLKKYGKPDDAAVAQPTEAQAPAPAETPVATAEAAPAEAPEAAPVEAAPAADAMPKRRTRAKRAAPRRKRAAAAAGAKAGSSTKPRSSGTKG